MHEVNTLTEALRETVIAHRRHLHAHPEPSFEEADTKAYICAQLARCGVPFSEVPGCNSIIARVQGGQPGKTVAFRADIDALRMQEQNDVPCRSLRDGVMHACGHDGHTAALLGLAELFSQHPGLVRGEVVLLFQHAEEMLPGGAATLVKAGALEGVDAVFGAHLWSPMQVGTVGYRAGAIMAAADKFTLTLTGQGGHGSEPHHTDDVLLLGAAIVQQLQTIVSRRVDPRMPTVLSVCQFHAGSAFNVIPGECVISGTVRTCDEAVRQRIPEQIRRVAQGIVATADNAHCELDYGFGYPAVINDAALTGLVVDAVRRSTPYTPIEVETVMGADDFAYFGKAVPATYVFVGAGNATRGLNQPHHSPTFDFDEAALEVLLQVFLASYLHLTGQD